MRSILSLEAASVKVVPIAVRSPLSGFGGKTVADPTPDVDLVGLTLDVLTAAFAVTILRERDAESLDDKREADR